VFESAVVESEAVTLVSETDGFSVVLGIGRPMMIGLFILFGIGEKKSRKADKAVGEFILNYW
jgi:hypothetical protein